jgi:hypothetical protein
MHKVNRRFVQRVISEPQISSANARDSGLDRLKAHGHKFRWAFW